MDWGKGRKHSGGGWGANEGQRTSSEQRAKDSLAASSAGLARLAYASRRSPRSSRFARSLRDSLRDSRTAHQSVPVHGEAHAVLHELNVQHAADGRILVPNEGEVRHGEQVVVVEGEGGERVA